MLLSELFDQLNHGELVQLSIGGDYSANGGMITTENYAAIIAHVNLGLTELHKIFPLKLSEAIVQEYEAINIYHITKEYAVNSGSSQPIKYILDTPTDLFTDNVLKIEKVYNEVGNELFLNNTAEPTSILTPSYNSIQIPNPTDTETISIIYRANHKKISAVNLAPDQVEIDISVSLMTPLLFYIAHRAYASVSALDGINQSADYLAKFNASIAEIKKYNLITYDDVPNQNLWINGWA